MTPITKSERDTLRSVVGNQIIPSQYIKRIVWEEVPRLLDALDERDREIYNIQLQKGNLTEDLIFVSEENQRLQDRERFLAKANCDLHFELGKFSRTALLEENELLKETLQEIDNYAYLLPTVNAEHIRRMIRKVLIMSK